MIINVAKSTTTLEEILALFCKKMYNEKWALLSKLSLYDFR